MRLLYRGPTHFAIKEVRETTPDGEAVVRQKVTATEVEPTWRSVGRCRATALCGLSSYNYLKCSPSLNEAL